MTVKETKPRGFRVSEDAYKRIKLLRTYLRNTGLNPSATYIDIIETLSLMPEKDFMKLYQKLVRVAVKKLEEANG